MSRILPSAMALFCFALANDVNLTAAGLPHSEPVAVGMDGSHLSRIDAIVAKGDQEDFKSSSGIVARLPSDVVETLQAWHDLSPVVSPEAHILMDKGRPLDYDAIRRRLRSFERRWRLKHLSPALFRHWVKTTCRRLSDPALAALQGHKPPKDGSMRNRYDTPNIERILEEQEAEFPEGPLVVFRAPQLTVAPQLQREMKAVLDWKEGRLSLMKLMELLEELGRESELHDLVRVLDKQLGERDIESGCNLAQQKDRDVALSAFELGEVALRHSRITGKQLA